MRKYKIIKISDICFLFRNPHSRETTHFPQPTFLSSSALLCLETARVILVTSEMAPSLQDEAIFQNSIRVCHFWPRQL